MSQQAEGVLTIFEAIEELVRSQVVVSKEGYSSDGTDLFAFPESGDSTFALNDLVLTESMADDISAVGAKTILIKENDNTFTIPIQTPNNSQIPVNSFGLRLQEIGAASFVYTPPTISSSDWDVGQQAFMIDRDFETAGVLNVTNNVNGQTTFDFGSSISRDIVFKIRGDITAGSPTFSYNLFGSDTGAINDFTFIETNSFSANTDFRFSLTSSFAFFMLEIVASGTAAFTADLLIYYVASIISPTITSSTWPGGQEPLMVDGDLSTFGLVSTTASGAVRNSVTFNFSSGSNYIVTSRQFTSKNYNRIRLQESNDNVNFTFVQTVTKTDDFNVNANTDQIVVAPNNEVYALVESLDEVQRFSATGTSTGTFSISTGSRSITSDSSNNIYVGFLAGLVEKYSDTGTFLTSWTIGGGGSVVALAVDTNGDIYALDGVSDRVYKTDNVGAAILDFATFNGDESMDTDSNDNLYIVGGDGANTNVYSSTGTLVDTWATTKTSPSSIAIDSDDIVYIATLSGGTNDEVDLFAVDGTFRETITVDNQVRQMQVSKFVDNDLFIFESTTDDIERWSFNIETDNNNEIIDTVVASSQNFIKFELIAFSTTSVSVDQEIYEIFRTLTLPTVDSSDWASTSNMISGDISSFDTLAVAAAGGGEQQTTFDFGTIELRNMHVKIQVDTIDGTPIYAYVLEVSDTDSSYVTIDSGALLTGVSVDATNNLDTSFRFARIRIEDTLGSPFESNFSIFQGFDSNIINDLDFSTIRVGGSSLLDGTVDQTDPLEFQVLDGGTILHPPRYFDIDINKFFTVEVVSLRTGQIIATDRVMTWQRNFTV